MTLLEQVIRRQGFTGTAAEVHAALIEKTIPQTNTELWTYAGLASRFGAALVTQLDTVIQAAGLGWASQTLAGTGLNFDDDETRNQIETLCAGGLIEIRLGELI